VLLPPRLLPAALLDIRVRDHLVDGDPAERRALHRDRRGAVRPRRARPRGLRAQRGVVLLAEAHAAQREPHRARAVQRRRDVALQGVAEVRGARVEERAALLLEHLREHVERVHARRALAPACGHECGCRRGGGCRT
jgi:hypothetical protein